MANVPFQYDDELLSSCATSSYAESILSADSNFFGAREENSNKNKVDPSCQELFRQFASHYGREADTTDAEPTNHDRLHIFVSNAVFVHRHNNGLLDNDADEDEDNGDDDVDEPYASPRHRVSLNQFSDRHDHELPLMVDGIAEQFLPDFDSLPVLGIEHEYGKSQLADDATSGPIFSKLEYEHFLKSAEEPSSLLGFGSPMRRDSINTGAFRSYFSSGRRRFEDEVPPLPGSASSSSPVFIWSKKGQSSIYLERETDRKRHSVRKDKMDGSDATPYAPPSSGGGQDANGFLKSLDWSTTNNPDGVPIVHPVIDQGSCGSCWAISATGTVEANAARHRAFEAYTETEKKLTTKHQDSKAAGMVREAAVAAAREAEANAFNKANLSIQELVDCDTRYDQGCTGGNPLLAYYFIHRYGLASSAHYPYKGKQRDCKVDEVTSPIATAESWGVLTPNHEENMELVLRYIGPIAVGVNGADPSFLAYEGGIFHSKKCGQNANHAMLIVGYGQETDQKTGKITRYWIARNSWGTGWGEKGYVRMKRGSGKKGKRGVCGIARSPSVALGSSLLATEGRSNMHSKTLPKSHGRVQPNRLKWPWVEALVRCQDRAGAPISCTDYRKFAQHLTMASVVLTMVVVGTWLRVKLTRSPTTAQHNCKDQHQNYHPTGNKLVDSLELSSNNERTRLIRGRASDREATAYGSSNL